MFFIFEGMDNCLKDTIIQELRSVLSPETQVLKFSNPPKDQSDPESYQKRHFKDMFDLLELSSQYSERNLILNRAHLGELVYSPIYRNYDAAWIFDLEKAYIANSKNSSRIILILLYDSNNEQLKLREDGRSYSLATAERLNAEREKFINAFDKSLFTNKLKFDLSQYSSVTKGNLKKKVDTKSIIDKILTSIVPSSQQR